MIDKKEKITKLKEVVEKVLDLYQSYWPSFSVRENMAEDWTLALLNYDKSEIWKALKEVRSDLSREFAPPLSKLIGTMDQNREIAKIEQAQNMALLEAPRKESDFDAIESYSYKTSRTKPKIKKDESDHETRKALRVTRSRRSEIERRMRDQGFVKVTYELGNGVKGFEWKRQ